MKLNNNPGPRLTDDDFFNKIDCDRPGLEMIPAAVLRGDFSVARQLFAREARKTLDPKRCLLRSFQLKCITPVETLEQAGERILLGKIISCGIPHQFPDEINWTTNPTANQYKEWPWQLNRHWDWAILGECYRRSGDGRFAAGIVRHFKSWVKQAVIPEAGQHYENVSWRTIEAGIRMAESWPWALHCIFKSPSFTDDVLIDWYKSSWEHANLLRHYNEFGNWLIIEMTGLVEAAILFPEFKDSGEWKEYSFKRLTDELDNQIYPDGWMMELTNGYHQGVVQKYQDVVDFCRAYDVSIPDAFRTGIERMHTVKLMIMMPDGRMPDLNDGDWRAISTLMEPAAQEYPERLDFKWAASEGAVGSAPQRTSFAFPYAGYYVMRTGWQRDAVWAFLDGGHLGIGAHAHEDKGNILFHAYGRLLLTEGGNYAYDTSAMRKYVLSTRAHNTIRVNGYNQNRSLHYRNESFDIAAPSNGLWDSSEEVDTAVSLYDEGYGPEARRWAKHERKVILIKKTPENGLLNPFAIVVDRITPADSESHQYQALWHLGTETNQIMGNLIQSSDLNLTNLAILSVGPDQLSTTIVSGQEEPEFQGWIARSCRQGDFEACPTALVEWEMRGPVRLVTLLYPIPAGKKSPILSLTASSNPEETQIVLTLTDGTTFTIHEKMNLETAPLAYSL